MSKYRDSELISVALALIIDNGIAYLSVMFGCRSLNLRHQPGVTFSPFPFPLNSEQVPGPD